MTSPYLRNRYADYVKIAESSEKVSTEQFKISGDMYDSYSFSYLKNRYADYVKEISESSEKISDAQFKIISDMYDSYSFKEPIKRPKFNKAYIVHKELQACGIKCSRQKLINMFEPCVTTDMKK